MLGKARGLLTFPLKLIPVAVFGILLTATINIVIANIDYNSAREELEETAHENNEEIWEEISEIIEENYYSSKLASNIISLNLENSIIENYSNLDELEDQLDKGVYSEKFHDILKDNIEKDDVDISLKPSPYFTIVGKMDSVLVTFSNDGTSKLSRIDTKYVISWDEIAKLTPNPSFTMKAVDRILNKSQGIIFTQTGNFQKDIKYPNEMSMETLKNVYDIEGIEGLGKFSLMAPSYITEDGDIFGNDDRYYLSKNYTHKLITVQVISLETVLSQQQEYINMKIKNNSIEEKFIEKRILDGLITTVLISLMLFIISLILIGIHNAESDRKRKECGECSKKGE